MTLQDEESPIHEEIENELVSLIPEAWDRAVLEVKYEFDNDNQIHSFDHVIYNPDILRDLVTPSDVIYDATFRIQRLFRKYGGTWNKVSYEIRVLENGIQYKAKYDLTSSQKRDLWRKI